MKSHNKASHSRGGRLSLGEATAAFLVFAVWLALFAGGILVDTRPYRVQISPSGVAALEQGSTAEATNDAAPAAAPNLAANAPTSVARGSAATAWIVVLLCFLPINLAWICAASSTLGAFGNRANLSDDHAHRGQDRSNPYVSAVLRGFFVYLFMTSGLLLLDDAPFSSAAPGQYIRLAGFLSLFSFVVSYQPRLFNVLIVWAFQRIQVREGEDPGAAAAPDAADETVNDTLYARKTTVEVAAQHTSGHLADAIPVVGGEEKNVTR